jgi:hypothetical protein
MVVERTTTASAAEKEMATVEVEIFAPSNVEKGSNFVHHRLRAKKKKNKLPKKETPKSSRKLPKKAGGGEMARAHQALPSSYLKRPQPCQEM